MTFRVSDKVQFGTDIVEIIGGPFQSCQDLENCYVVNIDGLSLLKYESKLRPIPVVTFTEAQIKVVEEIAEDGGFLSARLRLGDELRRDHSEKIHN